MRKNYQITGTSTYAASKQELKTERDTLNKAAGVDITKVPAAAWPHKITKGPEHPHITPFFREVRLGAKFRYDGFLHKKVSDIQSRIIEDGVLSTVAKTFNLNAQVSLA